MSCGVRVVNPGALQNAAVLSFLACPPIQADREIEKTHAHVAVELAPLRRAELAVAVI
jgi:hypothetical protein